MFAVTPPVDLEGYLTKRGEVNKSWQRRYFVLKGNLLFYFDKRGDREPLGVIIIEGCTIGNILRFISAFIFFNLISLYRTIRRWRAILLSNRLSRH